MSWRNNLAMWRSHWRFWRLWYPCDYCGHRVVLKSMAWGASWFHLRNGSITCPEKGPRHYGTVNGHEVAKWAEDSSQGT